MTNDVLDPVEAQVIEDLHRRNWIIEKESHKEYGRVLAAATKQQFGSILEKTYLNLDEATRITHSDKRWVALGSLLVPVKQDVEIFKWVISEPTTNRSELTTQDIYMYRRRGHSTYSAATGIRSKGDFRAHMLRLRFSYSCWSA